MFKDENRHYSLRKLSVGLASILIGISFSSVKANTAYADSLKPGSAQTEVINQKVSNTNQDITNSSKLEAKVENVQKQATATNKMVNKKQDGQVSRQVNEVNNTTSPEKSKVNTTESDANAQTKQRDEQTENILQIKPAKNPKPNALKQNLVADAPESEIVVKTRNDIDQNKLSASRWQFTDADDNNKAIAGSTIIITGNSGDTFTKDQITLPKGYEDRNDLLDKNAAALKLPAAGTITTYTLPLSHHHTDLTKQAPEDEVEQTRTVTVHYKYLDGDKANQEAAPDAKLDIYYSRNKFKDDVTGEISYTHWSWDKSQGDPEHPGYHIVSGKWDNLPEQWDNVIANVPTIAGYTAVLDEPNRPDNTNHVNANKFVHPLWNNSLGSGVTDANKDSLAYLATNTLYEAKNEHTVYYKANDENTNDAFALDSKNGLHEHANVDDNGGYDADYWGKINVDDWNYTVNNDRIEINGLKDGVSTGANDAVIVPNLDDFKLAGKDGGAKAVYISKNTLSKTSKHKYYGLSKTNGSKFVTDNDLNNTFNNSKLTYADLNNLNTGDVTDIHNMFDGVSDLNSLDVSDWNTSKVTDMSEMFEDANSLTNLDVSNWKTGNVTSMEAMFAGASSLTDLDVSKWDTGNVTDMSRMFVKASSLTSLDVSKWNTGNVTDMNGMFGDASSLANLDVSKWDTRKVGDMYAMFYNANSLTSLNVSNWDTGNVPDLQSMFKGASSLALIVNGDKFADYLVNHDSFGESFDEIGIDVDVKSVTTDNAKLLQLLTNDSQHDLATRTIVFTFPAGYSPDLTKYHLTKTGNTYQIKQSADYDTSYVQGTVLINATDDITKHHIDTTKPYKLSDAWQPNYDKLVLAHKNADGTVSFDKVQLPKVPGYKAKVTRNNGLLMVSYLVFAPEKPATNNNLNELQFSNKLVTNSAVQFNSTVNSNIVVKSDMYQVVNDDHNWQLPVIKSYDLKFATNKNQIIFAYTKDKQYNYRFVLAFKDGQYQLATFNKQGKLLKTYSIKSYNELAKIIHSLVSMNIA